MLGSIDSNTGDTSLGWDTDQFPMNLRDCAFVMKTVIAQGGLAPGGLKYVSHFPEKVSPIFVWISLASIAKFAVNQPICKICSSPMSVPWIVSL